MIQDLAQLYDADEKFIGVINRIDKANLEPGYVAEAINRRFDRNVIKNRWGVVRPVWGGKWTYATRNVAASSTSETVTVNSGTQIPDNVQVWSDPGLQYVESITVTTAGTGYTNGGPYDLVFVGGGGSGAAGTFTVSGGGIDTITITATGSGYTSTPTIDFSDGGAGSGEAVTVNMVGQLIYANGTRCIHDDGVEVLLSARSNSWDNNADLYFFNGLEAVEDIVGMLTYREPVSGLDVLLVASNETRSDGGQGTVYVFHPGQSNTSILLDAETVSMNGHDFYGEVKMVQCGDGVLMLRQGLVRYYFTGDTDHVSASTDRITLNVTPTDIETGDKVQFVGLNDTAPNLGEAENGIVYFARRIASSNAIELYDTKANAEASPATTGRRALTASDSTKRYYIQVLDPKNFWTHQQTASVVSAVPSVDAPPLIMQATQALPSPVSVGFDVLEQISVTSANTTTNVLECENHRLLPGDAVIFKDQTGLTGILESDTEDNIYYVYPTDPNHFAVYEDVDNSLSGDEATRVDITLTGTANVKKSGVSGSPMPNCREALYFGNRVFAVYGDDFLAISDILDPLTYLPLQNEFRLNSGTNDRVVAIYPFNESTIIIFKQRSVLALTNATNDLSSVRLIEITRDYGCIAPKSIASTGSDIIWLSQRGIVSLKQTDYGLTQSVIIPLSDPIQGSIDKIDWSAAVNSCGSYFDNKYLIAIPVSGGTGRNALTLVYNFLTSSWDGEWEGNFLVPRCFEKMYVNGTQRLVFADDTGFIHFFDPYAFADRNYDGAQTWIETSVSSRGYTCGTKLHKQWTDLRMNLSTWSPLYSIEALFDDYNSVKPLKSLVTKSRNSYYTYGTEDFDLTNADDNFLDPNREDYSTLPTLTVGSGFVTGLHQTFVDKSRPRGHSSSLQFKITTTQGSVQINGGNVSGVGYRQFGSIDN